MAKADKSGAIELPKPLLDGQTSLEDALAQRRSVRDFASDPLPLAAVAQLLWAAQGITDPDGLRTAPSAGALYPLELYLVAGKVEGLPPGAYRYAPRHHRLLQHEEGDLRANLAAAALEQDWVADAPAILVFGAVYQRTARRYGTRATRYVHMEVGHAAQNVCLEAVALDFGSTVVGAFDDRQLHQTLKLPREVDPLALMPVGRPR